MVANLLCFVLSVLLVLYLILQRMCVIGNMQLQTSSYEGQIVYKDNSLHIVYLGQEKLFLKFIEQSLYVDITCINKYITSYWKTVPLSSKILWRWFPKYNCDNVQHQEQDKNIYLSYSVIKYFMSFFFGCRIDVGK